MDNGRRHIAWGRSEQDAGPFASQSAMRGRFRIGLLVLLAVLLLLPAMVAAATAAHACDGRVSLGEPFGHAAASMCLQGNSAPSGTGGSDHVRGACAASCPSMVPPPPLPQVPATPVGQAVPPVAPHPAGQLVPPDIRPPRHAA